MAPHDDPEDQDWLESVDRDELFTELYHEHYPSLVRFFGRRGLDPELSRDLAQDAMTNVLQGLGGLSGRPPPAAWVLTIATNVWRNWVRDHRRTLKRGRPESSLEAEAEDGFEPDERGALWPGRLRDPETVAIRHQAADRLRGCVSVLTRREREMYLPWLEGASYREIAARADATLSNVKSTLHAAKRRIVAAVRAGSGHQEEENGSRQQ